MEVTARRAKDIERQIGILSEEIGISNGYKIAFGDDTSEHQGQIVEYENGIFVYSVMSRAKSHKELNGADYKFNKLEDLYIFTLSKICETTGRQAPVISQDIEADLLGLAEKLGVDNKRAHSIIFGGKFFKKIILEFEDSYLYFSTAIGDIREKINFDDMRPDTLYVERNSNVGQAFKFNSKEDLYFHIMSDIAVAAAPTSGISKNPEDSGFSLQKRAAEMLSNISKEWGAKMLENPP